MHLLLRLALLVVALPALAGSAAAEKPALRPNILFLFSDDQRFDTIHALGNRQIQTPNLDRLVRDGFSFTHTFCMGSLVPAVCVPSRAMMLTGRSLFRATVKPASGEIPPAAPTWPEVLRQAGYSTLGIGKWHNDRAAYARSFTGGGPVFLGGMTDHTRMAVHHFDRTGVYAKTNQWTATTFSSELFAEAAMQFLRASAAEKPFLLYVAFTAPHDPRMPPKEYAERYRAADIPLPKSFLPEHPFDNGELKVRDEQLLPWPRLPEAVRQELAAYYGMITHLDAQIGRILRALEETGRADNTVIIFAADNGLALGRHGLLGKQNLYEHSVRVPLIMSGPGIPKSRKSDALCYLFDLYPTICELSGLAVPPGVEGRSLVPILKGRQKLVRDSVFGAYRDMQRMVRGERWKLIDYPQIHRSQLFDLKTDAEERNDLSAQPKYAGRLAELRAKLVDWQKAAGDPLLKAAPQDRR